MNANSNNYLKFNYVFDLETGESLEHLVEVSKNDIISKVDIPKTLPEWVKLENNKCSNCTLHDSDYCPIAVRLIDPIKKFHNFKSHCKTHVTVISNERNYSKDTDLQDGLRSLFGLIMATSGCPSMDSFRPMALHHLPFASINETIYKIVSMFLVKRFSEYKEQSSMPISVQEIEDIYNKIEEINFGMKERLLQYVKNDSTLNAIIILDSTASMVSFRLEKMLQELQYDV